MRFLLTTELSGKLDMAFHTIMAVGHFAQLHGRAIVVERNPFKNQQGRAVGDFKETSGSGRRPFRADGLGGASKEDVVSALYQLIRR